MSIVLLTLVLIFISLFAKYLRTYKLIHDKLQRGFTRPPGLFILGHTFQLLPTSLTFNTLNKYHKKYGDLLHIQATYFNPFVSISDVNIVKQILSSKECLTKASFYKTLNNWLGNGLGCSTGTKWHKMRKTLQPAFTLQSLIGFINIFNSRYEKLIQKLEDHLGEEVEITRLFNVCSLDVVCESTLGLSYDNQSKARCDFLEKSNKIVSIIIKRTFHPWRMSELLYFFTRDKWLEKAYVKAVRDYTKSIISSRRNEMFYEKRMGNNNQSFIDILLNSDFDGRLLTDEEICDEINLFLFAGNETVAYALAYVFRILAKHQDVQERVVDELKEILLNDKSKALSFKDLQEMKYLEMVIKETLRLYPPIGIIGRTFDKDQIFNNLLIPANIDVIINVSALHKNPKYFPHPEKFDPERFRYESKMDAFMPFSAGPRNCIGTKWHKMRKTLQPAFTLQSLIGFINIFNSRYERLIQKLEDHIGEEVEITRLFNVCSLDVVCESTLGLSYDNQSKASCDFLEKSNKIVSIIIKRTFHPWRMSEFLYFLTRDKWLEKDYVKAVRDYTKSIIASRRNEMFHEKRMGNNNQSFIDILLNSDFDGRLLTDEEICDEINLFLFAGNETVAYALAYVFRILAKHQDVQERVVQELKEILLNNKSRALNFKDLQEMKYLEMVIKETLRLYPPIGIIGRTFDKDQIFNNLLIPANIDVIINVSALHKNPKYFPDPETFDPERFRYESKMDAFMPFSAGPRNCIGYMFAMLQIKSATANILRRLKVLPDNSPEPDLYFDVIIKPKGGIKAKFENRIFG